MRCSNLAVLALALLLPSAAFAGGIRQLAGKNADAELKMETKLRKVKGPKYRMGEIAVPGPPGKLPPGYKVVKHLERIDVTIVRVPPGRENAEIKKLSRGGKKGASLNYLFYALMVPNDPYCYPYQWHLSAVQAEDAWDVTTGEGITVAVVDTGLNPDGLDGIGCVSQGYDFVSGDSNPRDGDGHGTHVSGTIGQKTNNNRGVAGLAYGACVMPIKVLDDGGSGSYFDIAEGIRYAVDNSAKVINMSLGGGVSIPVMDAALDYAYNNGVTVVAAAGNDGSNGVSYPASHPHVISVGATGIGNYRAPYSNYGVGLDIMAPGGDLFRDINNDGYGDGVLQETNGGYYFYQGTSMAAPHVAAAAAMVMATGVATSPDDVRKALQETALDLGTQGYDQDYGNGMLQVMDALNWDGAAPTDPCDGVSCDSPGPCEEGSGTCTNGDCSYSAEPDGTLCDDDNQCTSNDTCQSGACQGSPVICMPTDQCHDAGTCNPNIGICTDPPKPDGTPCNDEDSTTVGETCNAGVCEWTDPCNGVSCNSPGPCEEGPGTCTNGDCSYSAKTDGTSCNDEDPTTVGETCTAGVCSGGTTCKTFHEICNNNNECCGSLKCHWKKKWCK